MIDRRINETDLREILARATSYRRDAEPGRWIIEAVQKGQSWEIVVEPIAMEKVLVVITAFVVE
jgi:hypothetical protein